MKTLDYRLSQPVPYADQGETVEGEVLVCTAPKGKNRKDVTKLKQMFFRSLPDQDSASIEKAQAAKELKEEEASEEDISINGNEILFIVMQSAKVEYDDFIELGRKVLSSGCCSIDGVKEVNSTIIDRLSVEELENVVGEYVAFFIVSSAMKSMQNNI